MKTFKYCIKCFLIIFLVACSSEDDIENSNDQKLLDEKNLNVYPAPTSGWGGETDPYLTTGFTADVMPFYDNGLFHSFFLHDAAIKPEGKGFHPIHKFVSENVSAFSYEGEQIPYGKATEPDFAIGTGSTIKVGDTYYFYYTGFNDKSSFLQSNPRESILLAKSSDLENWEKDEEFRITASENYYDFEFRDPEVFYNEDTNEYWMLVCTQFNDSRKAVILVYTSTNPENNDWKLQNNPLYITSNEENYLMMECPDMFKMNGTWYLIFSENWKDKATHYRMASSPYGPWETPDNDLLDGRYYYAAKTETDGNNRYIFGWTARKFPENDNGNKEFGGNMVVHEITQNSDRTLNYSLPGTTENLFLERAALELDSTIGSTSVIDNNYTLNASGDTSTYLFKADYGTKMLRTSLKMDSNSGRAGFIFQNKGSNTNSYQILLEPASNRIVSYYEQDGNFEEINSLSFNLETGKEYSIKMVMDETICVLYIDGKKAFSNRIYEMPGNTFGFVSYDMTTMFNNTLMLKP